jgi:hypothetical protein
VPIVDIDAVGVQLPGAIAAIGARLVAGLRIARELPMIHGEGPLRVDRRPPDADDGGGAPGRGAGRRLMGEAGHRCQLRNL